MAQKRLQVGDFVEAEAEPLRGFDEPHPCDIGFTIATNAARRLIRLEQQPLALIEPDGFPR
jgi:hypothetical protein